jgi:orotate phosphoribosyltransferase-like protein
MKQKALTKSDKIRKFLDRGLSRPQICKKLNVSQQLVYIVARNHGMVSPVKRKNKRNTEREVLEKLWSILKDHMEKK